MLFMPLLPIDETRYASVAWEMWTGADPLLPMLNGEPYNHKPPLLFWLIHLGWAIFGVNEWWLRLMPALFALGSIFLTHRLARQLWPGRATAAVLAPAILLAMGLWLAFMPLLMFDIALSCWILLAVVGLLDARRNGGRRGWLLFSVATLLGLLTKGPVVLLHVVVPGLLVPFFVPTARSVMRRSDWYAALAASLGLAVAGALLWAIPAAIHGGAEYARGLFWDQTRGRVIDAFAHRAAWWWYLPFVPAALFPWVWWPPLWRAMRCRIRNGFDPSLRFCALWVAAVFLVFSVISGKRLHYLIPLLPVLALLAARGLDGSAGRGIAGVRQWPVSVCLAALAIVFAVAPALQVHYGWPVWVSRLPVSISMTLLLAAVLLLLPLRPLAPEKRVLQIACISVVLFSVIKVEVVGEARPYYELRQISAYLARSERQRIPIGHLGAYHGQYHFLGRLHRPFETIPEGKVAEWVAHHDAGLIVSYPKQAPVQGLHRPRALYPYRGRWVAIWSAKDFLDASKLFAVVPEAP